MTESGFLSRSEELQGALTSNQFADYCQKKMESAQSVVEEDIWSFMKVGKDSQVISTHSSIFGHEILPR